MERKIVSFDKEYDYLSNFYPAPVMADGLRCKRQLNFEPHADENLSHLSTF